MSQFEYMVHGTVNSEGQLFSVPLSPTSVFPGAHRTSIAAVVSNLFKVVDRACGGSQLYAGVPSDLGPVNFIFMVSPALHVRLNSTVVLATHAESRECEHSVSGVVYPRGDRRNNNKHTLNAEHQLLLRDIA